MTRDEKMSKRRESGKVYEYKPNPYPKNSDKYWNERIRRSNKNVSHKTPVAQWTSFMRKVDNELEQEEKENKAKWQTKKDK